MSIITNLTSEQLRKAADLKEQITKLEQSLAELLGGTALVELDHVATDLVRRKKRKISAAGIARIKAAQKVRWAKYRQQAGTVTANGEAKKKKLTMSDAAKAKIAAAARARWARVREAKAA